MADAVLSVEARLQNFMSGEIEKIRRDLGSLESNIKKTHGAGTSWGKTMNREMGGLRQTIAGLGPLIVATFSVGAISRFFSTSINEGKKSIEVETRLTQALGFHSAALANLNEKLQQTTAYEDDEIAAAQAVLAMNIKDEAAIARLTPAVLDLARAKGITLTEAANLLNRAVVGSSKSSRELKVTFDGQAGSQERLNSVITETTKRYKGQAEAFAQTDVGKMESFRITVSNLQEQLGKYLIPYLGKAAEELAKVVEGVGALAGQNKNVNFQKAEEEIARLEVTRAKWSGEKRGLLDKLMYGAVAPEEALAQIAGIDKQISALRDKQKSIVTTTTATPPAATTPGKILGMDDDGAAKKAADEAAKRIEDHRKITTKEEQYRIKQADEAAKRIEDHRKLWEEINSITEQGIQQQVDITTKEEQYRIKQAEERDKYTEESIQKEVDAANKAYQYKVDLAKKERDMKMQYAGDVAQSTIRTVQTIAVASKANALVQKRIAQGMVQIDTALAIMKTWATVGYPWAIPLTIAMGATATAQAAIIERQKFARGGIVEGANATGDRVPVLANAGEMILNRSQQSNLLNSLSRPSTTNNATVSINLAIPAAADRAVVDRIDQTLGAFGRKLEEASRRGYINWNNLRR